MLTRKALKERIDSFLLALKNQQIHVRKVVLFGSYAKGNPHEFSDIDLAVWADEFAGNSLADVEKYSSALSCHSGISVRPYKTGESPEDDPFLEEVLHTGMVWPLP
ncbi:MAG: nucleotidyltransferase domain-containing protein [Bacteroidia bacterium]|jgi:predicted nucleotidyltransferase